MFSAVFLRAVSQYQGAIRGYWRARKVSDFVAVGPLFQEAVKTNEIVGRPHCDFSTETVMAEAFYRATVTAMKKAAKRLGLVPAWYPNAYVYRSEGCA